MLKATVEQVEKMSWKQIRACMDFCHLYVMNAEAREIYGYSVKEAFERVARPHYARLQNERAEAFWEKRIAERGW
jgi:endonuclease IV